ncbi:MAG: Gfo/Idh/MocA family oxidoreductase [Armatimonadota bacterium]|nr:MAG: Gfo/Idh/MocA family oxidoreductase [Armatimonadota bacterium]
MMNQPQVLGVGMVGYGFMGKVHTYAYRTLSIFYDPVPVAARLVGVCTSSPSTCDRAMRQGGYEMCTDDYRGLLERDDIDIIHCCTPNDTHRDVVVAAIEAGKHVYCDKPLARDVAEAEAICAAAREGKRTYQMAFNYRFVPALMRAKELIGEGFLGEPLCFRAVYLHAGYVDPERPMSWRLDAARSGGGALLDLGSHIIDLVRHLLGDFREVRAMTRIFTSRRPVSKGSADTAPVEVDDSVWMQAELACGAVGTLEASRVSTGASDEIRLEIHGRLGAIAFNLMDPNWLYVYDNRLPEEPLGGMRGFTRIESVQRYPAPASLAVPKNTVGWLRFHVASIHSFLENVAAGRAGCPSLEDGLAVQRVMDAAYRSASGSDWVTVA